MGFTVFVTNFLNPTSGATSPAGLIASIRIRYTDDSSDLVGTDPSWLNGPYTSVDAFLSASDSVLAPSFNVAAVGAWPWGQLSGISNVLAVSDVPSGPFTSIGNIASTTAQGKANAPPRQSAGFSSQSQSAALGTGGSPSGSAAASSADSGRSVDQSTATGSATNASGTSGSGTAALPFSSSTSASPMHATPVAAIVGAIASMLTLVILGLVIFCWRRRRYPRIVRRQSQGSSIVPFTGETTDTQMAELRPQGLANPALQDRPLTKREREASAGLTRGPSNDALVSVALLHSLPMAIPLRRNAVDPPPREKANAVLLVGRFRKQNLPVTHSLRQFTRTNSCFVDIFVYSM
ncbi:hypothetical protein DFH08DRAFT_952670 [Mycena albidolilacea]|uniref:Uncharacterized protein n=1 Tax=Mycena albidolilacea TaxID=1033008 RepID=A0AAD7AI83_9AGAR|nr:hypothetical protein DFH08DRAFT_952670 [Mycena albidolilacea]